MVRTVTDRLDLVSEVGAAMRRVAHDVVLPRFGALRAGDTREKTPGDLVTVADTEAEEQLTQLLLGIDAEAVVVGEEAVAEDPSLLQSVGPDDRAWIVDPIDGTSSFVDGSPGFAMMVALWERGTTTAAWILQPVADQLFTAALGEGAWLNGRRIERPVAVTSSGQLRVVVHTRYLSAAAGQALTRRAALLGEVSEGTRAAGIEYPSQATGGADAAMWWRTYPWDHAPGALIVEEAGGKVARLDGSPYDPWDAEAKGAALCFSRRQLRSNCRRHRSQRDARP